MTNKSLFGELLRDWRQETLGLTLQEFTQKLSECGFVYSDSSIARYERGERKPTGEFLSHLTLCFDLSRDEVISWLEALSIEYLNDLEDQYTLHVRKHKYR